MKTLIIRNNFTWDISKKLEDVKAYFAPIRDFTFDVIDTKYKTYDLQDDVINGYKLKRISDAWFDENISKPYKDKYDCVVFMIQAKDWKLGSILQGYRTHNNLGIQEITLMANKSVDGYDFNGSKYDGDQLTWILKHELAHALYLKEMRLDNTHTYYQNKTPEKVIEDFKPIIRYKYFSEKEIVGLKPELVSLLDKMRGECGFPFKINSGFRTKEFNATLKDAVIDSAHTTGEAVDIACTDSSKRMKMISSALMNGISRVGIADTYLHFDIDKTKPQKVVWLY